VRSSYQGALAGLANAQNEGVGSGIDAFKLLQANSFIIAGYSAQTRIDFFA
jgi:hypothetical protein